MSMMNLKGVVSNLLEARSIKRHRSRVGWRLAPVYTQYLDRCRREAPRKAQPEPAVGEAVETFRRDGITSFRTDGTASAAAAIGKQLEARESRGEPVWSPVNPEGYENYLGDPWIDLPEFEQLFRGDLGDFLTAYFGSPYKILYGTLYRTRYVEGPHGSQLWHSDGGPGICVNVMYYLHDMVPAHGALEAIPWGTSERVFTKEKKLAMRGQLDKYGSDKRDRICRFYESEIDAQYKDAIQQPVGRAGLVVPFLNNTIHRGGYPHPDHTRTAIVFHCYPSHRPTDLDRYRKLGIKKTMPYPKDPALEF
jgi:hypothetical protein